MTIRIQAGFDLARIGEMIILVTENTGPSDFVVIFNGNGVSVADADGTTGLAVNDAETTWCHETLSSVLGGTLYQDFASALESGLEAGSLLFGNSRGYQVTYSSSAHTYTIAVAAGTVALAFDSPTAASGTRMRQLLGFSGNQSTAASHVGTIRPYYTVIPSLSARSKVTRDNEQAGLISGAISASGAHYSISPTALPTLYDMTSEFESDASSTRAGAGTAVYTANVTATVPWSWEHFFQHVRGSMPFLVHDGTEGTVHTLRPDAAHFNPTRRQVDWDMWDIDLRTYLEGRV